MSEPVTLYVTPYPDKRGHDTYTTDEGRIPSQHIDKARYRAIPAAEFDALVTDRDMLKKALVYVHNTASLRCDDLHHVPRDTHDACSACPVEKRVRDTIDAALRVAQ
jgi:hypothetical protein